MRRLQKAGNRRLSTSCRARNDPNVFLRSCAGDACHMYRRRSFFCGKFWWWRREEVFAWCLRIVRLHGLSFAGDVGTGQFSCSLNNYASEQSYNRTAQRLLDKVGHQKKFALAVMNPGPGWRRLATTKRHAACGMANAGELHKFARSRRGGPIELRPLCCAAARWESRTCEHPPDTTARLPIDGERGSATGDVGGEFPTRCQKPMKANSASAVKKTNGN